MELENYKAIVFDLGGTLMEYEGMPLDWSDYYYRGFKKINENFGLDIISFTLSFGPIKAIESFDNFQLDITVSSKR